MPNKQLKLTLIVFLMVCTSTTLRVQAAIDGPLSTTIPVPLTLTDWTSGLPFPQFNPSLGTLLSVTLDLSSTFNTTLTVTNEASSSSNGSARTEVQLTVQDSGSNLTAPAIDLLSTSFAYSLAPGDSITSGLLTQSGSSNNLYTLPVVLAEFTGAGSIDLHPAFTTTSTLIVSSGGNTSAAQVTDASLTGSVTYTYTTTSTPEPSTLVIWLGIGALGLLAYGRTRRSER